MSEVRVVSIIGAGIVGLATALKLKKSKPDLKIIVIEKESTPGAHQSTHNSGVLHSGLYYTPQSFKAKLCRSGIDQMLAFCENHKIPHEICGKIVVASDPSEVAQLRNLFKRGITNGLKNIKLLSSSEIKEIEPNAAGIEAIHVPEEGIVDYKMVVNCMKSQLENLGVNFEFNFKVSRINQLKSEFVIESGSKKTISSNFLINCAGLYSDKIAFLSGVYPKIKIVPFRGEYSLLSKKASGLVKNLIYPVPDPKFPFLGVHFTRLIHGGIEAGPNAILALGREAYSWGQSSFRESFELLTFPGVFKFIAKHPKESWRELSQSISLSVLCKNLQKLVPSVREDDLLRGHSGVRAQAMHLNGTLCNDFVFEETKNSLHVLNAPSPAATASLAIADEIISRFINRIE